MKISNLNKIFETWGLSIFVFPYLQARKPNQFRLSRSYKAGQECDLEKDVSKALAYEGISFKVISRIKNENKQVDEESFCHIIIEIKE